MLPVPPGPAPDPPGLSGLFSPPAPPPDVVIVVISGPATEELPPLVASVYELVVPLAPPAPIVIVYVVGPADTVNALPLFGDGTSG